MKVDKIWMDGEICMVENSGSDIDSSFDIYFSLGIIVKGRTDSLKELIKHIEDMPDVALVFTKTSIGKLRIVDVENESFKEKE